ncbi:MULTISPECIES: hypothetical protein [Sorangium]|uniref:Uncharacterized protein n=1 Tax=Sorangium cellulosum TaxID=56 RepID=A0A4P2R0M1_SORCE|nr:MULTISPECIES: hypothetical protein [Sorangium]AUX36460.1 uncharacterized protein SOCE836_086680 [Sorangium cellulosum]WCQ95758.1 hypothetical protein NQZ70_08535 [Sorangium sp. Soce836]
MLRAAETVVLESGLQFLSQGEAWRYDEDWPHIATFHYKLATDEEDGDRLKTLGEADGYRISQDWAVESDLQIWNEADALDGDVVRYVEALIREVRSCEQVFDSAPSLTTAQRITILRHVEAVRGVESTHLMQAAAASLAMMDAPVLMLVDPWPMADERRGAKGKLSGRSHIAALLEIGFVRMVGSRFLWAWNRELSEGLMADYSYDKLLAAKRKGALDEILNSPLSEAVYGSLPKDVASRIDVPDPDDLMSE